MLETSRHLFTSAHLECTHLLEEDRAALSAVGRMQVRLMQEISDFEEFKRGKEVSKILLWALPGDC